MGGSPMDSRASALVPRDGNPTRKRGFDCNSSLTGLLISCIDTVQLLCRTAFPGRRKQRKCSRRPGKAVLPVCLAANQFNQQSVTLRVTIKSTSPHASDYSIPSLFVKGDHRTCIDRRSQKVGSSVASIKGRVCAVCVEAIFDESPISWPLPRCCCCNLPKRDGCAPIRLAPRLEPKSRHRFPQSEPLSRHA